LAFKIYPLNQKFRYHLREFALCYERHPESMRTVPRLRPAGHDSIPADAADAADARACPKSVWIFRKIFGLRNTLENKGFCTLAASKPVPGEIFGF